MKLVQNPFIKSRREFEIIDNAVHMRVKGLLKEEKIAVPLILLNPKPVVNGNYLEFYNRDNTEVQLSLYLNKPNASDFNEFVDTLKQRVPNTVTDDKASIQPAAPAGTTNEEPPEFKEYDPNQIKNKGLSINVDDVNIALMMLNTYMDSQDINPLTLALEKLKLEPQSEACQAAVLKAFNDLGVRQGAVLTYAPYLNIFVSDDPFGD